MKALLIASRRSTRNALKSHWYLGRRSGFGSPLVAPQSLVCRCCQTVSRTTTVETTSPPLEARIPGNSDGRTSNYQPGGRKLEPSLGLKRHYFSTTAAADATTTPSRQDDAESSGESMTAILEQESDPQALFEELGMKEEDLYELASQRPTPLRLVDMYKYATNMDDKDQRLRNAQFLHRELPIRIAQRAVDLLTLPHGLSDAIPIRQVACAYIAKMHRMRSMPRPTTFDEEEKWTDLLQSLVLDRSSIPMAIARGLADWASTHTTPATNNVGDNSDATGGVDLRLQEMEDALYRFFTARVGVRFLTEHHILSCHRESTRALRNVTCMFPEEDNEHPGCIHSSVDLVHEISRVANLVYQQTKEFYGDSPEIEIVDCITDNKKDTGEFTYVPNHLHYMMEELLKNSCRATIHKHLNNTTAHDIPHHVRGSVPVSSYSSFGSLSLVAAAADKEQPKLPPIRVVIVKGDEDVTIKVADRGGGIPRSKMNTIWKFAHSTADKEEAKADFGNSNLSGFKVRGFGLPLCRIYARYLGGELTLKSMEGYGLDAYLHLPRLGVACENLPRLVRYSPGERDSTPVAGWYGRGYSTVAAGKLTSSSGGGRRRMLANQTNSNSTKSMTTLSSSPPSSTKHLMEELKQCLTQEAKNQRILDFIQSRT